MLTPDNFIELNGELQRRASLSPSDPEYINLADIAYVLQPVTYDSWGLVVFFHEVPGVGSGVLYSTALIMPGSLHYDFSILEDNIPSSVREGENVTVEFLVKSTFTGNLQTDYTLLLDGDESTGTIEIDAEGEEPFSHSFTMPDHDVTMTFKVNPSGENPHERNLDNNEATVTIYAVKDMPAG